MYVNCSVKGPRNNPKQNSEHRLLITFPSGKICIAEEPESWKTAPRKTGWEMEGERKEHKEEKQKNRWSSRSSKKQKRRQGGEIIHMATVRSAGPQRKSHTKATRACIGWDFRTQPERECPKIPHRDKGYTQRKQNFLSANSVARKQRNNIVTNLRKAILSVDFCNVPCQSLPRRLKHCLSLGECVLSSSLRREAITKNSFWKNR